MAAFDPATGLFSDKDYLSVADMQAFEAALLGAIPALPPARNQGRLQAQWVMGSTVSNGVLHLCFRAPYAGTIASLDAVAGTGTFTAAVAVNGNPVGGLEAVAVDAMPGTTAATGAARTDGSASNAVLPGDDITATVSAAAGPPTDAVLNLNLVWS